MENRLNLEEKVKALSVFKWTMRRQLPFSIAYWILLFLSFPVVNILTMIVTTSNANYGSMRDYIESMGLFAYEIVGTVFSVIAIVHSVVMGIMTFSYMHNKRSVDLYGSLPVSRRTMFFSRYCALVVSNIVPIVVFGTVGALLTFNVNAILEVYMVIGILIFATVGNISFIAFISLCCGTVGDVIVSYMVVNIVYPICVFICNFFPMNIVPGVTHDMLPATVYSLFSPFVAHFTAVFGTGLRIYAVWWIVFTVVLLVGCNILCKKRKAETAQNAFAFAVVEIVIKFITCFAAGFGLGWIMTYVGNIGQTRETQWLWFTIGAIIGVMTSNGLLHLIFHRGFSKFKTSLKECLVVFATDIVFLVVVTSGMMGYDTRVPKASDVQSVDISFDGEYNETFIVNGKNLLENYHDDKEIIESVVEAHQTLVTNIGELKLNGFYPIIRYFDQGDSNFLIGSVKIKYKMKNGNTITRYYDQMYGYVEFADNLKNLSQPEMTILENIPTKYISYMDLTSYGAVYHDSYYLESNQYAFREKDIEKIVEALKKDIEKIGYSRAIEYPVVTEEQYNIFLNYTSPDSGKYYDYDTYVSVSITNEFTNTLEALAETGYGNTDLYMMEMEYISDKTAEEAGYEQTGDTIYFRMPQEWSEELEIRCLPHKAGSVEPMMSMFDEMTKCEKVSDGVYKYTLPKKQWSDKGIASVMFYQYTNTSINTTYLTEMEEKGENLLYKNEESGEFEWAKYVE